MKISGYTLQRIHLELPLPIGDSQVRFTDHWMTILELSTDSGLTGLGFELQQGMPIAALPELQAQFQYNAWPVLQNEHPASAAMRVSRPRGGERRRGRDAFSR